MTSTYFGKSLKTFLISVVKIGLIGFGGGSALIPVLEDELVDRKKIATEQSLSRAVIVASVTPGALPVEVVAGVGRKSFGRKGMVLGALSMALPGAVLTILVTLLLTQFQETVFDSMQLASVGITSGILYLLVRYIRQVVSEGVKKGKTYTLQTVGLMLSVFALVGGKNIYRLLGIDGEPLWSFSTVQVLIPAFLLIIYSGKDSGISKTLQWFRIGESYLRKNSRKIGYDVLCWVLIMAISSLPAVLLCPDSIFFIGKGILSSWLSFGGGDAYLTIADGLFVSAKGVSEEQFYSQIVPMVNVLPGSILCKTLTAVGYFIGWNESGNVVKAVLMAMSGLACSLGASCGLFIIAWHAYEDMSSLRVFQRISRYIRPIIAGLLLNIMLSLLNQCKSVAVVRGWNTGEAFILVALLFSLDTYLVEKRKWDTFPALLVNIVVVCVAAYGILGI